nr:hypothetical transcript [Hymenolepis microstoma]
MDGVEIPKAWIKEGGRAIGIPLVQPEDQAAYECSVTDAKGSVAQPRTVSLQIRALPYFTNRAKDEIISIGSTVNMVCEAEGIPKPIQFWFRNGMYVRDLITSGQLDGRKYVLNDGTSAPATLTISNVDLTDSAMFDCLAVNSLGTVTSSGELRVLAFPPNFQKNPMVPVLGMVGKSAVMTCQPEAAPIANITWYFNEAAITPDTSIMNTSSGEPTCAKTFCSLPSGNLLVHQLTKAQEGTFECRAQNQYGMATTSAYLTVIYPVVISLKPQNTIVDVNSTGIVPCKATVSSFLDVNYAWYYEAHPTQLDGVCVLWTWEIRTMRASVDFDIGTPLSAQSENWNWLSVRDCQNLAHCTPPWAQLEIARFVEMVLVASIGNTVHGSLPPLGFTSQ